MDQEELRRLEDKCIQEHAPACTATCPIHVDARGICAEIAKADFQAGLKIYTKTVPFPRILSLLCDQPCQEACLRKDIGGAISIKKLEKSLIHFGGAVEPPRTFPKKPRKVAVIGAGLSGLTVAFDLVKKGYQVIVFEKETQMGGVIHEVSKEILPQEIIEKDFQVLATLEVEIRFQKFIKEIRIDPDNNLLQIEDEFFHTVYLGCGKAGVVPNILFIEENDLLIDPFTYETKIPGIFAAGSLFKGVPVNINGGGQVLSHSIVQSMAQGRSAALSMDRYLQNVSLTAARKNEGSYVTRLYTNIKRYEPQPKVVSVEANGYQVEEAIAEAQRCIQCECMECVKECVFMQEYGSYPKRYLREVYNNLSIVQGTRQKNRMINSCSLCGLCGEICPEDLDMSEVFREARQTMVTQNRMPPSAHDFALRDMQFSNSEHFSLIKHQPGSQSSAMVFFPGCQLCASYPEDVEKIYQLLCDQVDIKSENGIGLALGCCGAPAEWAGREQLFEENRAQFLKKYQQLGQPILLVACSSCFHVFKKSYPELEVKSLWVYLNELKLDLPDLSPQGLRISIQDPCTTRYERDIQEGIRQLVEKMGVQIEELPLNREQTECCSYGGLMWLANRDVAKKVVARRINQSPLDYLTYCAMCRDFFAKSGKNSLHLVDLLFHADTINIRKIKPAPDFSFRHENRSRLKNKLLKTLWGDNQMEPEPYEAIKLIIAEEIRNLMEERMILVEDVQQVIQHAEKSGSKLKNTKTGTYLAHYCPASVTFWVEYRPVEDAFEIVSAYCHRMTIEDEVQK